MSRFLVVGILSGAVYALLALGLVLVYKGARVFNFAQAEFGTVGAYLTWALVEGAGVPWLLAAVLAVAGTALLGFLVERLVVRPLFDAPRVTLLVATAGVALLTIQTQLIITGPNPQGLHRPIGAAGIAVLGVRISPEQIVSFLLLAVLGVGMAYFFNRTDLGLAVLATSQEPVATELVGIGTRRMSSFIWTLAAALGGLAGILVVADQSSFTPAFMTRNYLLASFTAAVVGGISSLSGAFAGGMIIGVAQSLGAYYLEDAPLFREIPGPANILIFLLLLGILLVRPRGLLGRET